MTNIQKKRRIHRLRNTCNAQKYIEYDTNNTYRHDIKIGMHIINIHIDDNTHNIKKYTLNTYACT